MTIAIKGIPTGGTVVVGGNDLLILAATIPNYADDAAAAVGGVPVGGLYRTGSILKVRVT